MDNMNIFEYATRNKVRFPYRGVVSVEDLWDVSVDALDLIYKQLNSKIRQASEESLLNEKTNEDRELRIQIDIVKHIFNVRLAESEKKKLERERKAQKQKIMSIIANKQEEGLQSKSIEELTKMLDDLD